ncbi:hypothetical protein Lepto7376_4125 [[Leptolyngbya] sp. PCC 7376]|uniref:hypothetical protein n=1 Tax=[Leptolyngbya] sp. PCC 7376 TaxID=111781 RepID=UPI00029F1D78|nr:hypothetical protein [[Leptolyngbya] sp. PCC 7376]AFY40254.1 hypothetical protein Lepto7376_4125 [[Leptolyngbya] sp. PCC 7376]
MNTPSHYVINLALLGNTVAPNANVAITLGAIAPDAPIFIFYAVAKFIYRLPEQQIWSEAYFSAPVQFWVSLGHSFPVAIAGLLLSIYFEWRLGVAFFASMIGHSLLDIPVHHDDAHRHFFPLTDYKFISPLSYWDINHHARIVAGFELAFVAISTPFALGLLKNKFTQGLVLSIDLVYIFAYFRFFVFR